MATTYLSITGNGFVLVAMLVFCSVAVDWLAFHYPIVQRFVHPERKPLVVDGRIIRKSLKEELMTEGELLTQLRLHDAASVDEVKAAYLEGNGEISVIQSKPDDAPKREVARAARSRPNGRPDAPGKGEGTRMVTAEEPRRGSSRTTRRLPGRAEPRTIGTAGARGVLAREVRLLGALLGQVIVDQAGPKPSTSSN